MENILEILKKRQLIAQMTHEEEMNKLLNNEKIAFYVGFDATANSLHIGHLLQIMVIKHLQNYGHKPIILLGGGTTLIGDPTGRTESRPMKTKEEIEECAKSFEKQFKKFVDFSNNKAIIVNNAKWLSKLTYIEFLREVGTYFSVNKMLTAECFKSRLEVGLSFLEFNYMLMQGYDFYYLNENYNCKLELGGNDQWANIISGVELIRKKAKKEVYGMTFNLLTNSEGKKMGKTLNGAIWLDGEKTTPYEFYQYFRNIPDADVIKMLKMLTFVPIEEIAKYEKKSGRDLNEIKSLLAKEITKFVHGDEETQKVENDVKLIFLEKEFSNIDGIKIKFETGMNIVNLLVESKIVTSKNEARRVIEQGGISVNNEKITNINHVITNKDFPNDSMIIQKGKKIFVKIMKLK